MNTISKNTQSSRYRMWWHEWN